jgi:NADH:ubiquinone oxidoreductase subunit 4 (subunit M)
MPVYATLFIIATLASIGLPGTNGFVGEFMVITGTFVSNTSGTSTASRPWARRSASSSARSTC